MSEYLQHYLEVLNCSCSEPTRQLVRVADVHRTTTAEYMPPSVLLRRCSDQTGFCDEHKTCRALANTTIQRPIKVDRQRSAMQTAYPVGCVASRSLKGKYAFPLRIGTKA